MIDINQIWIDLACPNCGYQDIVQMIDIKSEKIIFCHNCKVNITMIDAEASVHSGVDMINDVFKKIEKTLNKF